MNKHENHKHSPTVDVSDNKRALPFLDHSATSSTLPPIKAE